MSKKKAQRGFTLLETLVSLAILVIVAGTVIAGMIRMTWSQQTITNRTQVHSSVRNATELMQQEIGQAGRLAFINNLKITGAATVGSNANLAISSTTGLFDGEQLVFDPSSTNEETITITTVDKTAGTISATFANAHAANTPVLVMGGFASGIIPPTAKFIFSGTGSTNTQLDNPTPGQSSDGTTLKLYGDLNGDGNMVYVVYKCAPNTSGTGTLTRYVTTAGSDITASTTTAVTGTILLDTLANNPPANNPAPCFTYSTKDTPVTINGGQVTQTFVINVAVTLTVQTQNRDLQTNTPQFETKALLNISPRNVFNAWELASMPAGYTRSQPMPGNVKDNLLTANLPTPTN